MSIKSQLSELRERQAALDNLLKTSLNELANEELCQKLLSFDVDQLSKRNSELAIKLYHYQIQKLEHQNQKVSELKSIIEAYQKESSSNIEKITSYLEDTSFYINEQVSFLVQGFLDYVKNHETEIGTNITSQFLIEEAKDSYQSKLLIPNGNFVIKLDKTIILKTKDYYFTKNIYNIKLDPFFEQETITITDWYVEYANIFKKTFKKTLKEEFKSNNFKLTFKNDSFTIELL